MHTLNTCLITLLASLHKFVVHCAIWWAPIGKKLVKTHVALYMKVVDGVCDCVYMTEYVFVYTHEINDLYCTICKLFIWLTKWIK